MTGANDRQDDAPAPKSSSGDETSGLLDSPGDTTGAYSLAQLVGYFLKLGALGFGGPVALVGYMHRDLVERLRWYSEADYKEGLSLAQLAPGPLAAQLAIYLGFVHYRYLGATAAGIAFCLPSFAMVVALGWAYQRYNGLGWMQAVFYGVGAAVIGIIARSAYQLTRRAVGVDVLLWLILAASAVMTVITETEYIAFFLGAGGLVWLVRRPPRIAGGHVAGALAPLAFWGRAVAMGDDNVLWQMALFFSKAGAFVFGSGLAIVPFLYSGAVKEYGWLDDAQFLDAVAVAMITPGPVVITVGFIGYLVAGFAGACVASVATFLPCYLFTILPAPLFKRYGRRPGIVAFVDGVTVAAVGAICGAVVVLGRRTLLDDAGDAQWPKIAILAVTLGVLIATKRIPEPVIVLAAAIVGLVIFPYVGAR
ncbi:MAG: chromate transporter [Pirellulales bacterium]